MQSVWSTQRKSKINLNAAPAPDPTQTSAPPEPVGTSTIPSTTTADPAAPTVKRRTRRTDDQSSSKRQKTSQDAIAEKYTPPTSRLSDLGGLDASIEKMLELVAMPICHPEIYLHTGVQPPRGVLLHGPPGCGKTLLANAMAGVSRSACFSRPVLNVTLRNLAFHSSASRHRQLFLGCPENRKRLYATPLRRRRYVVMFRLQRYSAH